MGLCASTSLKNKNHTHTASNCLTGQVKKLPLFEYSCRVRDRGKKSSFESVQLEVEMDAEIEAALQGYGGMPSTPVQPLWQRRILMGERCEMPRFSGLILYDERGFPLPSSSRARSINREMRGVAKVALKDIL
ncbi:hypothetical protein LUZ63_014900 [Rhynchospora breviuscula]|uniref:Uncharacterized protein n=1 Tax=Rhynchospora breviuscula TaxID=2022672 RepID=A0A9Q0CBD9_9POAL|nr:hypothetical protein LUZ63_014900 [Rhynchospora breviuscula]